MMIDMIPEQMDDQTMLGTEFTLKIDGAKLALSDGDGWSVGYDFGDQLTPDVIGNAVANMYSIWESK